LFIKSDYIEFSVDASVVSVPSVILIAEDIAVGSVACVPSARDMEEAVYNHGVAD
jgi:hypothetical protein